MPQKSIAKQNKTKPRKDIKNATKTREQHSSSPPLFCFFLQILTKEIEVQIFEGKGIQNVLLF